MKTRVVLLWTCMFVAPLAAIQACGGKDDAKPAADSGAGAVDAHQNAADAKADATEEEPEPDCDKSADFTTKIVDASIADGASSTGVCVACMNAECKSSITACNKNCLCQSVADKALTCLLANPGNPFACASALGGAVADTDARNAALGMATCLQSKCKVECAVDALLPPDGGADAADAN